MIATIFIIMFLLGSLAMQYGFLKQFQEKKLEKLELTLTDIFNMTILVTIIYNINHNHHNYD